MVPARVKTAPRPELKSGLFSRAVTTLVAISRDVALGSEERRAEWECKIERSAARWARQRAGGRLERVMLPQPPWRIIRGVVWGGFPDGEDMMDLGVLESWDFVSLLVGLVSSLLHVSSWVYFVVNLEV